MPEDKKHIINSSFDKKRKVVGNSSLLAMCIMFTQAVAALFVNDFAVSLMSLGAALIFFLIFYLVKKNLYEKLIKTILFLIVPLLIPAVNYLGGNSGSHHYLYSMIILVFYVYDKISYRYMLSAFYLSLFILVTILIKYDYTQNLFKEHLDLYFYLNIIYAFIALILISSSYTTEKNLNLKELFEKNVELKSGNVLIKSLMKELNHRVKNNLQIISALFNLQKQKTKNEELKVALNEARSRILSIALLHQKLYKSNDNFEKIEMRDYLQELCYFIIDSGEAENKTELEFEVDEFILPVEESVHVGLLVNEIIINSLKYANIDKENKKIKVFCKKDKNELFLKISDNGKGFPENFLKLKEEAFGIFLMEIIAEQYNGDLKFHNSEGATVEVVIKLKE